MKIPDSIKNKLVVTLISLVLTIAGEFIKPLAAVATAVSAVTEVAQ